MMLSERSNTTRGIYQLLSLTRLNLVKESISCYPWHWNRAGLVCQGNICYADRLFHQVRNGMNTTSYHEVIAPKFVYSWNKKGREWNKNIMGIRREIAIVKAWLSHMKCKRRQVHGYVHHAFAKATAFFRFAEMIPTGNILLFCYSVSCFKIFWLRISFIFSVFEEISKKADYSICSFLPCLNIPLIFSGFIILFSHSFLLLYMMLHTLPYWFFNMVYYFETRRERHGI